MTEPMDPLGEVVDMADRLRKRRALDLLHSYFEEARAAGREDEAMDELVAAIRRHQAR